jgi:hypothetical protein
MAVLYFFCSDGLLIIFDLAYDHEKLLMDSWWDLLALAYRRC